MPPLLAVHNIHLSLPDQPLIEGGDLVLSAGQRLGIMGASGTGKSSLALALLGLLPEAFSWSAVSEWEGRPADFAALRGHAIGYIAQQPDLSFHPTLRLGRQLEDVLRIHAPKHSAKARTAQIQALLTFVELPSRVLRAYVHELSGGELQRLAIIQTLLPNPRLIIADEPTTALDPHTERQVLQLLKQVATVNNCALLTISHDPEVHRLLEQPVAHLMGQTLRPPVPPQIDQTADSGSVTRSTSRDGKGAEQATKPVLQLDALTFGYRSAARFWGNWGRSRVAPPLFEGLTAQVHTGETLGIVGASGAGKSSLLQLVAGVKAPLEGTIKYFDASGAPTTLQALQQSGKIQWVFQHSRASLPPHLTVGAVLRDALRHAGRSPAEVSDALAAVQLPADYAQRRPQQLSGGELQRISLARALVYRPQLLLLDEPTASLDATTQAAIVALLQEWQAAYDMAYLWVSHQRSIIAQVADRVLEV